MRSSPALAVCTHHLHEPCSHPALTQGGWRVGVRAAGGDLAAAAAAAGVVLAFFSPLRFLTVFLQQWRGHDVLPGARQHPQCPVCCLCFCHCHGGSQRGDPHQGEVPQDVPRQCRYPAPGHRESRDTFLGCLFPPCSAGFPSRSTLAGTQSLLREPKAPTAQCLPAPGCRPWVPGHRGCPRNMQVAGSSTLCTHG